MNNNTFDWKPLNDEGVNLDYATTYLFSKRSGNDWIYFVGGLANRDKKLLIIHDSEYYQYEDYVPFEHFSYYCKIKGHIR